MSDLNSGLFNKDSIHYPSRVSAHLNEIEMHTLWRPSSDFFLYLSATTSRQSQCWFITF